MLVLLISRQVVWFFRWIGRRKVEKLTNGLTKSDEKEDFCGDCRCGRGCGRALVAAVAVVFGGNASRTIHPGTAPRGRVTHSVLRAGAIIKTRQRWAAAHHSSHKQEIKQKHVLETLDEPDTSKSTTGNR